MHVRELPVLTVLLVKLRYAVRLFWGIVDSDDFGLLGTERGVATGHGFA